MIPEGWQKLIIEYEGYSRHWVALCIAPRDSGEFWWFKATGPTPSAAFTQLSFAVERGEHVGRVPAVTWGKSTFPASKPPPAALAGISLKI